MLRSLVGWEMCIRDRSDCFTPYATEACISTEHSRYLSVPHRTPPPPFRCSGGVSMQWWCVDAVITGGWCVAKKKVHTEDTTSHGEKKKEKKKRNKKTGKKKRGAEYRTRELRRYSLLVLSPTLQRHEFAKSIHATFLYPTARLPPLFDAVVMLSLIHISEPTRLLSISYAVFCLKKKK